MTSQVKTFRNTDRNQEFKEFLSNHYIATMATAGVEYPELAIIFYVFDGRFLFFKSRTASSHSRNLLAKSQMSLAIYAHESNYKAKYGVQIKGAAEQITNHDMMKKAVEMYGGKFEGAGEKLPTIEELCSNDIKSTFYKISIHSFKIIDEDKEHNNTMLEYENF